MVPANPPLCFFSFSFSASIELAAAPFRLTIDRTGRMWIGEASETFEPHGRPSFELPDVSLDGTLEALELEISDSRLSQGGEGNQSEFGEWGMGLRFGIAADLRTGENAALRPSVMEDVEAAAAAAFFDLEIRKLRE